MTVGEPLKPHDGVLEQGDIIGGVPIARWKDGKVTGQTPKLCVVTSNECTCEDFARAKEKGSDALKRVWIHVAPLVNAKEFPEEKHEELQRGKRYDKFFIFGDGGEKLEDHVANVAQEQPVQAAAFEGLHKVARLADWQFKRLQIHCAVCRFHIPPAELFQEDLLKGADRGT